MKKIISVLITLAAMRLLAVNVYAEEPVSLGVAISLYDGGCVAIADGEPLYTSIPVIFTPDDSKGVCSYSISIDDGVNFGGYVQMEDGSVTLFPDDQTAPAGRWQIRFRSTGDEGEQIESQTYKVWFDTGSPVIEFENDGIADGWLSGKETAHFKLTDALSGIGRVITRCNGNICKEEHYKADGIEKEKIFTVELTDTGKVSNIVDVECFDLAGNSTVLSFEYRVDVSAPHLSVQGIGDNAVLSCSGELEAYATDDSGVAYIDYVIERNTGDEIITTEGSDMPDELSLPFDRDGRYNVRIWATDGAGNRSDEIQREFMIDQTSPLVNISGVSESADHRGPVTVTVGVVEDMYEDCEVNIKLARTAMEKTEMVPINSYTLQAVDDSREVDIKSDGEYSIEVSAVDAAGNEAGISKTFRIDATAPQILVSGIGEGEMTSEKPRLKFSAAEMFYGSTIMKTVLSKMENGAYVPVSTDEHVMKSPQDSIEICPEEEGRYALTCSASDRSGNSSEKTIEFAVDYTPPVIVGMSDINNKYFKSFALPGKVAGFVRDAFGAKAGAYVNDVEFGEGDVIIEEGKYVLSIFAEDPAGNCAEDTAEFMVDHTSPQIVLSGFDKNGGVSKGSIVKVSLLEDCDTLTGVNFNGRNIPVSPDNTATIAINDYGEYDLAVKAEDPAGNITDTTIHTSAYLNAGPLTGFIKTEENHISEIVKNDKNDPDPIGLAIGLITVLTGTYGLTYRASLRH